MEAEKKFFGLTKLDRDRAKRFLLSLASVTAWDVSLWAEQNQYLRWMEKDLPSFSRRRLTIHPRGVKHQSPKRLGRAMRKRTAQLWVTFLRGRVVFGFKVFDKSVK